MPFPSRRRLLHPSRQAHPVPDLPVLAGAGGFQARVAEDGRVVSGNRKRQADPDWRLARSGRGDSGGVPGDVWKILIVIRMPNASPLVSSAAVGASKPLLWSLKVLT